MYRGGLDQLACLGFCWGGPDADQWGLVIPLGFLNLAVWGQLMAHGLLPYVVLPSRHCSLCSQLVALF